MFSRRDLLATSAATAASLALPPFALPAAAEPTAATQLNALMDTFFQENLRMNPESATLLGLDTGANADLKGKLRDESAAGHAKLCLLVSNPESPTKVEAHVYGRPLSSSRGESEFASGT